MKSTTSTGSLPAKRSRWCRRAPPVTSGIWEHRKSKEGIPFIVYVTVDVKRRTVHYSTSIEPWAWWRALKVVAKTTLKRCSTRTVIH